MRLCEIRDHEQSKPRTQSNHTCSSKPSETELLHSESKLFLCSVDVRRGIVFNAVQITALLSSIRIHQNNFDKHAACVEK